MTPLLLVGRVWSHGHPTISVPDKTPAWTGGGGQGIPGTHRDLGTTRRDRTKSLGLNYIVEEGGISAEFGTINHWDSSD